VEVINKLVVKYDDIYYLFPWL